MVGASRFELPTTRTPSEYATRLRHAPTRENLAELSPGCNPQLLTLLAAEDESEAYASVTARNTDVPLKLVHLHHPASPNQRRDNRTPAHPPPN